MNINSKSFSDLSKICFLTLAFPSMVLFFYRKTMSPKFANHGKCRQTIRIEPQAKLLICFNTMTINTSRSLLIQVCFLNIHKYPFNLIAGKMSTHKEYALIAILATAAIVGVGPAFGFCPPDCTPKTNYTAGLMTGSNVTTVQPIIIPATLPLSLSTDKTSYDRQSVVDVTGHVQNVISGLPVTLRVSDSLGNIVQVSQLTVDSSGNFETKFNTSSPLWARGGTYTIYAQYGVQQGMRMAQTQISIGISGGGASSCQPNQLTATINNEQYCIDYSINGGTATGATLSTSSKALTVNLQA